MLTLNPPSHHHPMSLESKKEVNVRAKMISLEFTAPKDTCNLELHLQQCVDPIKKPETM
jgi:pyruvate kinase